MKKAIVFLLFTIICHAQNYRFTYNVLLQSTKESAPNKYTMILDIDNDKVKFYDAINLQNGYHKETLSFQEVVRKVGAYDNVLYTYSTDSKYYKIESSDSIKWDLQKDTKVSDGFQLKKATTIFGGRNWTAWYTEEIPFSQGPYKFQGLPGLIVEIQDDEHLIQYKLIKTEKLKNTPEAEYILERPNAKKITLADFHKILLNYYNDPNSDAVGRSNMEDAKKRELSIQKSIRELFVEVERDKAVIFPIKK